ncbi:hypothetical protein [Variovorax sp. W2I14]|uniref:hypothetical protein n=1 Tax=Variovorax sp. W2I14 TaxID=3042290 RepID=UPI003D1E9923
MSTHRVLKHLDKVIRDQKAAPVSIDQPHFLFDSPHELPSFGEHQLCVTPYDGHLADMKLVEWGCAPVAPSLVGVALGDIQLVPQS